MSYTPKNVSFFFSFLQLGTKSRSDPKLEPFQKKSKSLFYKNLPILGASQEYLRLFLP